MFDRFRLTSVLVIALLVSAFVLGACDPLGDDDDDDSGPDAAGTEIVGQAGDATPTEADGVASSTEGEATTEGDTGATEPAGEEMPEATTGEEPAGEDAASGVSLVTAVQEVTEKVRPAVVFIAVTQVAPGFFGQPQEQRGVGSGVIFDEQGHILTNNHVVEGADELQVALPDGRTFDASVIGRAPANDLAVIQIEGADLPVAELGSSEDLEIGQWVVAIGNALGLSGGASVTAGVVSALERSLPGTDGQSGIDNLIQTDAAINPGNSGGPLLNLEGQVVGINTAKIQQAEGIGFAVPIDIAREVIDQILNQEPQAALGVTVANVTPEVALRYNLPVDQGVLVIEVTQDGAAAAAGLQPGDIIIAFEDEEVATAGDLRRILRDHAPGDSVSLTIVREGEEQQIEVTLGESVVVQ